MKTAKEMNAIATQAIERELKARRARSESYLEEKIFPQIEQAAEMGRMNCKYHVDAWVDIKIITTGLEQHGYTYTKNGYNLTIWWTNF